jgi:hypothetical protein
MLCMAGAAVANAQDVASGRATYRATCAVCHSDPPGTGSVDPRVRTADEIRGAMLRVSPMGFLNGVLSAAELDNLAAYFRSILDQPSFAPDFDVSGQWQSQRQTWWTLFVTQYAAGTQLSGGWLTFDATGAPTWLFFYEGGGWIAAGVYSAKLRRNTGPPFATDPNADGSVASTDDVGTIAFVFSDRNAAEVTFDVGGTRVTHRIGRVSYPK